MTELLAACLTMLAIDYGQTMDIKNHPGRYEQNIVLGEHPGDGMIRSYFSGVALILFATEKFAPKTISKSANIICVSAQSTTISNNIYMGMGWSF